MELVHVKKCCGGSRGSLPIIGRLRAELERATGEKVRLTAAKPNSVARDCARNSIPLWFAKQKSHVLVGGIMKCIFDIEQPGDMARFVANVLRSNSMSNLLTREQGGMAPPWTIDIDSDSTESIEEHQVY